MPQNLFYDASFATGAWAPSLQRALSRPQILPGWKPKSRLWRGTWTQWVQFEPDDEPGPFFWRAKPAALALQTGRESPAGGVAPTDWLCVGCYVERGVPAHAVAGPMDEGWHWHGFVRALTDNVFRSRLVELMLPLPGARRSLLISTSDGTSPVGNAGPVARRLAFTGLETLDEAKAIVDAVPVTTWIDVVIGCSFDKAECLSRQGDLVSEFRNPTVRAREMTELISGAMPRKP